MTRSRCGAKHYGRWVGSPCQRDSAWCSPQGAQFGRAGRRDLGLAFLWTALFATSLAFFIGVGLGEAVESVSSPAASHEVRQGAGHGTTAIASQPPSTVAPGASELPAAPSRTGVFFSIYYAMTGVHAIHILAGMGVIVWLLRRSLRGDFSPEYFGPVDYVGLYWHLVDLVWIYLFPLLYLIR